ncbi:MAG: PAS domain S-box protein, partial [Flavobacteriales bacterium]|nr:PAS domain S-box protein [Flavobacteriales bacterium]
LHNYNVVHWESVLLALIPGILNMGISIFALRTLPKNSTTVLFACLVLSMTIWQISDTMVRLSANYITAKFWLDMLFFGVLFIGPFSVHFALLYSGNKKITHSFLMMTGLYLPSLFFEVSGRAELFKHSLEFSSFWGWIYKPTQEFLNTLEVTWISAAGLLTLYVLVKFAYKMRKTPIKNLQSRIIAIGYAIPVLQGITTQYILPFAFDLKDIPLTTTFTLVYSSCTIYALSKYKIMSFNPYITSEHLLRSMKQGILVTDQNNVVKYVNDMTTTLLEYPQSELINQKPEKVFIPETEHKKLIDSRIKADLNDGAEYKIQFRKKSGLHFPAWVNRTPYLNEDGQHIGSLIIINDISERVQKDVALKESKDRIEQIVNNINETVYSIEITSHDPIKERILFSSGRIESQLGFKLEEWGEENFWNDLIHPSDKVRVVEEYKEMLASKERSIFTYRIKNIKTNKYIWVEDIAHPFSFDKTGNIHIYHGSIRDISEIVEKKSALQESESKIERILDNIEESIYTMEIVSLSPLIERVIFRSGKVENLIGIKAEDDVYLEEFYKMVHPEDLVLIEESFKQMLETKKNIEVTYRIKNIQTEKYIWIREISNPVVNENGEITFYHGSTRDVTENVEKEKELSEANERFQSILEAANDAIIISDQEGIIIMWNRGAEVIYGFTKEQVIGENVKIILPGKHANIHIPGKGYNPEKDKHFDAEGTTYESIGLRKNGEKFDLEVSVTRWKVKDNILYCEIIRDISDRKNDRRKLESANRELETFIYKASHDLKGPLANSIGLVNIAKTELPTGKLSETFDYISASLSKLEHVLDDLQQVALIKQHQLNYSSFELNKSFDSVINFLQEKLDSNNISVEVSSNIESITTDKNLLHIVLTNVIKNSIQYRNPSVRNPHVIITAIEIENKIQISIEDNGLGIPEENRPTVFDMFIKANTLSTGTGLGLYMVQNAVNLLKGQIVLESEENKNTLVKLTLPIEKTSLITNTA